MVQETGRQSAGQDGTAERLRPLVREDERLAEDLAALRLLADDAGVQLRPRRFSS